MASSTRAALPFRTDRPSADVRLFCLPFAGGSAATYRTWGSQLPSRIDVCPVELPGRGTRFAEPPMRDFAALVDHLAEALEPLFDRPVAFFGHSLGARVALELARRQLGRVVHLYASACPAPHRDRASASAHGAMSDEDLVALLRRWGGTPEEVLQNAELLALALPILRADLGLLDAYQGTATPRLDCPITVFAGTKDEDIPLEDARAWSECTSAEHRLVVLEAGHFFVTEPAGRATLLAEIARSLSPPSRSPGAAW